jgi:hypothetical protein
MIQVAMNRGKKASPNRSTAYFRIAQHSLLGSDLNPSLAWHSRWAVKPLRDSLGNLCGGQEQV